MIDMNKITKTGNETIKNQKTLYGSSGLFLWIQTWFNKFYKKKWLLKIINFILSIALRTSTICASSFIILRGEKNKVWRQNLVSWYIPYFYTLTRMATVEKIIMKKSLTLDSFWSIQNITLKAAEILPKVYLPLVVLDK